MDSIIFTGVITLEELKEERPREYKQLKAKGSLDKLLTDKWPEPWFLKLAYSFGLFVVASGTILIVAIIITMYRHLT